MIWCKENIFFNIKGCKTGYGNAKLPPGVSNHLFPRDPEKRQLWIKAIPRDDWIPSAKSVICSLHFSQSDFKTERTDSNSRRKLGELKRKRLKEDAIPRIFPGLPSYLSSQRPSERPTSASSSSVRHEREEQRLELESANFLLLDQIENFETLRSKLPADFPASWNVITLQVTLLFYSFNSAVTFWV